MAATIARATGHDRTRSKDTSRLGSESAQVEAATWDTFAEAEVWKNGHGGFRLRRAGRIIATLDWGPEDGPDPRTVVLTLGEGATLIGEGATLTRRERAAALLTDTDIDGILSVGEA